MNDSRDQSSESTFVIFLIFLRLGLTSFGGPVAHLGYFHEEFVKKRKWLSDLGFADLVAFCQFLPGPASSQVGLSIGMSRGGVMGGAAAWTGFTLPSALFLILVAYGMTHFGEWVPLGALHGLKIAAVAVVALAVWGMAKRLCTDRIRVSLMILTAFFLLCFPGAASQFGAMVVAGVFGALFLNKQEHSATSGFSLGWPRSWSVGLLSAFFICLLVLPIVAKTFPHQLTALLDTFYRAGALVFGGGHVVLPLLQAEVVPNGWLTEQTFMAGYGAAQAVPGPLFSFSAFLGASMNQPPNGLLGGLFCLVAIYLPSFFLVAGALPFWDRLRSHARIRRGLAGLNAAVVGLLLAALYDPVWTSAIFKPQDFGLALLAFLGLVFWKCPAWAMVALCGIAGWGMEVLL